MGTQILTFRFTTRPRAWVIKALTPGCAGPVYIRKRFDAARKQDDLHDSGATNLAQRPSAPTPYHKGTSCGISSGLGRWNGSRPRHPLLGLGEGLKAKLFVETVGVPGRKYDALQIQIFEQQADVIHERHSDPASADSRINKDITEPRKGHQVGHNSGIRHYWPCFGSASTRSYDRLGLLSV